MNKLLIPLLLAVILIVSLSGAWSADTNKPAEPSTGEKIATFGKDYSSYFPLLTLLTIYVLWQGNRLVKKSHELTRLASEQNKASQQTNILAICNDRYDKMWQLLWEVSQDEPPISNAAAYGIYRRFWGLQHDQYQYFKRGYVEEDTFKYWLRARNLDWHAPVPLIIGTMTFQDGWRAVKAQQGLPDQEFIQIMDIAMEDPHGHGPDKAIKYFHGQRSARHVTMNKFVVFDCPRCNTTIYQRVPQCMFCDKTLTDEEIDTAVAAYRARKRPRKKIKF